MAELFIQTHLCNGIWHTTSERRFKSILEDGYISPTPDLPEQERWGTALGSNHFPYARYLGGVSLFCFAGFDAKKYEAEYPLSSWRAFVPCCSKWPKAVWIELQLDKLNNYVSPEELLFTWKKSESYGHKIMPMIEAIHLGPVPLSAFKRAFSCTKSGQGICELKIPH